MLSDLWLSRGPLHEDELIKASYAEVRVMRTKWNEGEQKQRDACVGFVISTNYSRTLFHVINCLLSSIVYLWITYCPAAPIKVEDGIRKAYRVLWYTRASVKATGQNVTFANRWEPVTGAPVHAFDDYFKLRVTWFSAVGTKPITGNFGRYVSAQVYHIKGRQELRSWWLGAALATSWSHQQIFVICYTENYWLIKQYLVRIFIACLLSSMWSAGTHV